MRYGCARVSTEGQRLESQIEELRRAGVDEIYQEKYTGTTTGRPVFKQLLSKLQFSDILVVTKLDRFARNTREALDVMQTLFDHHVGIHILNVGLIDETPTGKLIFTVFSAFAQFERDLIISRTQEGKKYARAHNPNYHEGRKKLYSDQQIRKAFDAHMHGKTYQQISKETGISTATLKRRIRDLSTEHCSVAEM